MPASGVRVGITGPMKERTGEEFKRWDIAAKARENGAKNTKGSTAVRAARVQDGFAVEYKSINEASRNLNIASSRICDILRGHNSRGGKMCTTKGFTFVYAHESEGAVETKIALGRNDKGESRAVVALHTSGERRVYASSKEAVTGIGVRVCEAIIRPSDFCPRVSTY